MKNQKKQFKMENLPPVEEGNVRNSGSKARKIETIGNSKQGAQMERTQAFICVNIKVELGVRYSGDIVVLASRGEKTI